MPDLAGTGSTDASEPDLDKTLPRWGPAGLVSGDLFPGTCLTISGGHCLTTRNGEVERIVE